MTSLGAPEPLADLYPESHVHDRGRQSAAPDRLRLVLGSRTIIWLFAAVKYA